MLLPCADGYIVTRDGIIEAWHTDARQDRLLTAARCYEDDAQRRGSCDGTDQRCAPGDRCSGKMMLGAVWMLLQAQAIAPSQAAILAREARAAQTRFEITRRAHLPIDRDGNPGRTCDAIIGRICYWYDSTETPPATERREIAAAREKLIAKLDSAARANPSDGWLAGQRARYLMEAGRVADAAVAARDCGASRWWCAALEGLALHVAQNYAAADSAFAIALREMPAEQRCRWLDLRLLVADRLEHELARAPCGDRELLATRAFILAQPLWSTAGNDLRTEHLARWTMASLLADASNTESMGGGWGDDRREVLLRYGWSEWFTREMPTSLVYSMPGIVGYSRVPAYFFFPDVRSVRTLARIDAGNWALRLPRAPSRYAPRHIRRIDELAHQLVRLPRGGGDSVLLAVAYTLRDTAMHIDSVRAYLAVYAHDSVRVTPGQRMMIANDTAIVSVEVRDERTHHASRARYTIDRLERVDGWSLSDLLLYDASNVAGDGTAVLDTVIGAAVTTSRFSTSRPLGVYWELAGHARGDPMWLGVTVEPISVGFARKVAARLHLAPEASAVRLRWQGSARGELTPQAVSLRLHPGARGRYRVTLMIQPDGSRPLTAQRDIDLTR